MKLYPESNYSIEIKNDSSIALSNLKNKTLPKEQFVINWNKQAFLGEIERNKFELKLSKKMLGGICVIRGELENKKGTLEIRTSKMYKIIFIVIILFALSGIITGIIQNQLGLGLIFNLIMLILVFRFVFLEIGFRIISKSGINKLTEIIEIKKIKMK